MSSENNIWFVVKNKYDGYLALKHPKVMSMELEHCTLYGNPLPYKIVKEFETIEQAADFLIEINNISEMINNILKKEV